MVVHLPLNLILVLGFDYCTKRFGHLVELRRYINIIIIIIIITQHCI